MFGTKCLRCGKRVGKKYEFCPHCGLNMKSMSKNSEDYGFLGKNDSDDLNFESQMPFMFKMLKPLMNELNKQMSAMDSEMRKELEGVKKIESKTENKRMPSTSFSIFVSAPGQKPIRVNRVITSDGRIIEQNMSNKPKEIKTEILGLPKVNSSVLQKAKKLIKVEPETLVRRLSDKIVYELKVPGVKSVKNLNISKIENGYEIKAFSDKEVFTKNLTLGMPLVEHYIEDDSLFLEFGLEK
ncbi:MAG TPA: zinc ribbon domain-containing protein [Candidatus Paceibacterota bacterium]|nr:zinc ribbon domain-containing protein [Candidatus Paceibacterota bacterium]